MILWTNVKGNNIPENLWKKPLRYNASSRLEQVPQETVEYPKSTTEVHWNDISDFLTEFDCNQVRHGSLDFFFFFY